MQNFLASEKLTPVAFESKSTVSKHIIDILKNLLDQASFAIIIMTAEDGTTEGDIRARQNVIHEIGLFQGRLGFENVIILLQQGVEKFSNIEGLQYIPFSDTNIQHTFYDLREALKSRGLILG